MPLSIAEKWVLLDGPVLKPNALKYDRSIDPREIPRYTAGEVALFLRIPEMTLRSWVWGRPFPGAKKESNPLIISPDEEGNLLSFFNLTEAHILRCTRVIDGVQMKKIRDAIDYVSERYPAEHPLLTQEFA